MSNLTADEIRRFITTHLATSFRENGVGENGIEDDFDLMKRGIVDSIGLIQLIGAVEDAFAVEIDFDDMDPEEITLVGPLSRYIAERARGRNA